MICNLSMGKKKGQQQKKLGQKVPPPNPKNPPKKCGCCFFLGGGWFGWDGKNSPRHLGVLQRGSQEPGSRVGPPTHYYSRWEWYGKDGKLMGKGSPIILGLLGEILSKNRLLSISN